MPGEWVPDILGDPYLARTLRLSESAGGPPETGSDSVATLVRRMPGRFVGTIGPLHDVDVLYVHGWSDYFFQRDVATFWTDRGARFYALDLHGFGRSLREGQIPGYVTSLDEYDADISAALAVITDVHRPRRGRRLVLMGHSMGGLVLTLWAARHPGIASALVLNSPWLELQLGAFGRQALTPLVQAAAWVDPMSPNPEVDLGFYTRAQRALGTHPRGPEDWRPERGFPTYPGWLSAILAGHSAVAGGIDVGSPTLVLMSAQWTVPVQWEESMTSTDTVLDVDEIALAATRIGNLVTLARIPGAIHDVYISAPKPRAHAFQTLDQWIRGLAPRRP